MIKGIGKKLFKNSAGEIRSGWKLAFGVFVYAAVFFAVRFGLSALLGRLFDAWGLTYANLHLAPLWARYVVYLHADAVYVFAYLCAGASIGRLTSKTGAGNKKQTVFYLGIGLGLWIMIAMVALVLDCMRLEYPLSEPDVSLSHFTGLIALAAGCISTEMLIRRFIFGMTKMQYGRVRAYLAAAVAALMIGGVWNSVPAIICTVLMSTAGCAVYERAGLWGSAALNIGWSAASKLFVVPVSAGVAVYRIYHVSENWLTGGSKGAMHGWAAVFGWGLIAAVLFMPELRCLKKRVTERRTKDGKDQNCNCGPRLQRR